MIRIISALLGFGALCCLPASAQSFSHTHGHQGHHSHDTSIYVTHGTCCQQTVSHCGQAHGVTTHSHAHDSRGHHSGHHHGAHHSHNHKYAHSTHKGHYGQKPTYARKIHKGHHGHQGHVKYTPSTQHHNVRVYSTGHSQAYHQSRYAVHGSTLPTATLAAPLHPAPRRDLIILHNDRAEPWAHYNRGWKRH